VKLHVEYVFSKASPSCLEGPGGPEAPRVCSSQLVGNEAGDEGGDFRWEEVDVWLLLLSLVLHILFLLCCWTLLKYTPRRAPRKSTFTSLEDASVKQAGFRLKSPSVTAPDETTA